MSGSPPAQGQSVGTRAAKGIAWTAAERWIRRGTETIVFIALARILDPSDFGVVALATAIIALLDGLRDSGFAQAVIQRRDLEPGHLAATFWWSLGFALVLGGALFALAQPLADAMGAERLPDVVRALAVALPLQALLTVPTVNLQRSLNFRPLAVQGVIATLSGGIAGVLLALSGAGAYALVGRTLVELALSVLILWVTARYWPGARFSWRHLKDLLGFGSKLVAYQLLDIVHRRSDDFIIGASLGPAVLGIYTVAYRAYRIMTEITIATLSRVALPAFSALQAEPERVRNAYYLAIRLTTLVAVPAFAALAVVADDVIHLLVGPKWNDAVPVMQVLSFVGVIHAIRYYDHPLLVASGKTTVLLWLKVISVGVTVAGFLVAAQSGDIVVFAIAYAAVAWFVSAPMWIWALRRYVDVSPRRTLSVICAPIIGSAIMVGAGFALAPTLERLPRAAELVLQGLLMGTVYLVAVWVIDRESLRLLQARLASIRSKS